MGKSKTSSNISFGDQTVATPSGDKAGIYSMVKPETCKKLAAMIYKSGRMKTVFQTFVGDPVGKSITKESFLAAATLSKTGVTAEDTDAIFSLYAKKGTVSEYAAFQLTHFIPCRRHTILRCICSSHCWLGELENVIDCGITLSITYGILVPMKHISLFI